MTSNFVVTSYFTLDTPYADVAHKYILPSVSNFEFKKDVRGVMNLGSWQKNTSYKAQFILTMLEHHKENIVFVDCDAEILRYPDLFENIPEEYNFACHILDRNKWYGVKLEERISKELLTGTMFIRNTPESKKIVQEWSMACTISNIWEQQVLDMVLKKNNIPVYELPLGYCYIKTLPDGKDPIVECDCKVVVHNQVSRRLRSMIK